MHPIFRCLIAIVTGAFISACAAGPPQPDVPSDVRRGTYYLNKGIDLFNKGCFPRSLHYLENAHQSYTAMDDQAGVALCLNSIADIYFRSGNLADALLVYDDAVAINQSLGDTAGEVRALSNKAAALIAMDRLEEAKATLALADSADNSSHAALLLKTRALLAIRQNDPKKAHSLLNKALRAAKSADSSIISSIHYSLGHLKLLDNQPKAAAREFDIALKSDRDASAYFDIAGDLAALGRCHAAMGDYTAAVDHFKRSAKIYALLKAEDQLDEVVSMLKQRASHTDIYQTANLHWVSQWSTAAKRANLCR